MVQLSLKFQGGHQVLVASGGREGLEKAAKEQPDLILLDVMMPEMDGYETCECLKSQPGTRHIPVVFLSAKAQQSEIQKGRDLGAIAYLVKPFDPMTLAAQLEAIMSQGGQP
jgi:CheY-like chemotaxis protein